jgi:hypothetical protein
MRSELVFRALEQESNRYQLVQQVAKGTRRLHRPNTRVQETMNVVLEHFTTPALTSEKVIFEQEEMRAA